MSQSRLSDSWADSYTLTAGWVFPLPSPAAALTTAQYRRDRQMDGRTDRRQTDALRFTLITTASLSAWSWNVKNQKKRMEAPPNGRMRCTLDR